MNYLYGASVQGIQSFIFQTNKLKEIVGASQLVDKIFNQEFEKYCKKVGVVFQEDNVIISAAGNLKYLLDESDCAKIVKGFPRHISRYAPGITVSQAVVPLSSNLKADIDCLEQKLKEQRNIADAHTDYGFMGLERARRTGGVASSRGNVASSRGKTYQDRGTVAKLADREKDTIGLFGKFTSETIRASQVPYDIGHITRKHDNAWIAIVHADGNGLGYLLSNLGEHVKDDSEKAKKTFSKFSKQLEKATRLAAQAAFEAVLDKETRKNLASQKIRLPFRPVVLGGDDLTVIIRADLAFDFTKTFLQAFEKETAQHLAFLKTFGIEEFENGLTACAGIAYIKQAYPFHYGIHLAESLTGAAKKFSKAIDAKRAPSSLYFYKVQASYLDDLNSMKGRTHLAKATSVSFDYGPYLIDSEQTEYPNTTVLEQKLSALIEHSEGEGPGIGKFRNWLSELHRDEANATFMLDRMYQIHSDLEQKFPRASLLEQPDKEGDTRYKSIMNDLIVLSSF